MPPPQLRHGTAAAGPALNIHWDIWGNTGLPGNTGNATSLATRYITPVAGGTTSQVATDLRQVPGAHRLAKNSHYVVREGSQVSRTLQVPVRRWLSRPRSLALHCSWLLGCFSLVPAPVTVHRVLGCDEERRSVTRPAVREHGSVTRVCSSENKHRVSDVAARGQVMGWRGPTAWAERRV